MDAYTNEAKQSWFQNLQNGSNSWWQQRSKSERIFCYASISLAISTFIFIILASSTSTKNQNQKKFRETCNSPICISSATAILDTIDESVSPCNDFYHFACGNWLDRKPILDHKQHVSTFSSIQEDIYTKLRSN